MKTINVKLYEYKELTPEAQKKALYELSDINTDYNWWKDDYYDAEQVGIKITSFNLEAGIVGDFTGHAIDTALAIFENHGKDCKTYKITENYLAEILEASKDEPDELKELDESKREIIRDNYLTDLLKEYLYMLNVDYVYRTTEAAIIETIELNEYFFTDNGKLWDWRQGTGAPEAQDQAA